MQTEPIWGSIEKCIFRMIPSFYEKFYFTPGDLGYKVFETKYAKIGVLICWDQWYPEAARITSLMGAEILVLSNSHRLVNRTGFTNERRTIQCMANHSTQSCGSQWGSCSECKPGRIRTEWSHEILGWIIYFKSFRKNSIPGQS